MTVSTTDNRIPYSGNGVTTVFDFPYKFLSTGDLKVYVDDVLMTLTTDYSVGAPSDDGALVTFVVAPASGTNNIVILRDPDLLQQSALPSNGPFPSVTVETMVDKLTLQIQRLREVVTRSFRLADSDTSGASTTLPTPAANQIIGWNSTADGLDNYSVSDFATILVAGNYVLDTFSGDGVTTAFVLSTAPASINNTQVNIGGVYQLKSDYSLSVSTITFDTAPPVGVNNIEVITAGALPAQEPTDGSVTLAKMPDGVFSATAAALAKFADGFLSATAAGRAKMADLYVTAAKLAASVFNDLTTVTIALGDYIAIADASDSGNKKKALVSDILKIAPAFSAASASNQSVTSAVITKVTLATEIFDTNSNFSSSRFTPTVAGYYQINGILRASATNLTNATVYLYVNGAQYRQGGTINVSANTVEHVVVSDIIYFNGTTDYVELYGLIVGTSPIFDYVSASSCCAFSGVMVRAA